LPTEKNLSGNRHIALDRAILFLERDHPLTGTQSRSLDVGARVCWSENEKDQGTVVEKSWSGVTLKWYNREQQSIMHNDMQMVFLIR
jgi:hypothetical protein